MNRIFWISCLALVAGCATSPQHRAEWLVQRLAEDAPTLVGIDHGFSFPLRYFEVHRLLPDWPSFLDDFQRHWPTDQDYTYVDFVRAGARGHGNGAARMGSSRWRRLTWYWAFCSSSRMSRSLDDLDPSIALILISQM